MTIIVQSTGEIALSRAVETAWLSALPAARRACLLEWPDSRARRRSLLGSRLLLEGMLGLGYPPDCLAGLRYTGNGKPVLDLPVDISLSHCAGRILCALSTRGPVGVDVEPIGAETAAAFRIYLSARERAWAGDDPRRFCALWTRKEAVVKAAGARGLAQLREVRIGRGRATLAGTRWYTTPVPLDPAFSAHVAHAQPESAPVIRRIAARELLAHDCRLANAAIRVKCAARLGGHRWSVQ